MRKTRLFSSYTRLIKLIALKNNTYAHMIIRWSSKQLILQLKLGISHIIHKGKLARLRSLEFLYKKVDNNVCKLCGKNIEDVYHTLYECIHYSDARDK